MSRLKWRNDVGAGGEIIIKTVVTHKIVIHDMYRQGTKKINKNIESNCRKERWTIPEDFRRKEIRKKEREIGGGGGEKSFNNNKLKLN